MNVYREKKKEGDLTQCYDIKLYTNKIWKTNGQHKNVTKNFDNTTIADHLRTVSWSNYSHHIGVVKPVYGYSTFQLTTKAVLSKGHTFTNVLF